MNLLMSADLDASDRNSSVVVSLFYTRRVLALAARYTAESRAAAARAVRIDAAAASAGLSYAARRWHHGR